MNVLMLTDDVHRLDRRIRQQAESIARGRLGRAAGRCSIFGLSPALEREPLPPGVRWVGGDAAVGSGSASILARIWDLGCRLGLKRPLEAAAVTLRDPAGRLARVLAGQPSLRGFDVVVAHSLMLLPTALELRQRGHVGRVVFDAHEVFDEQREAMPSRLARAYWRRVGDQAIPRADGVLTVTPQIARLLAQRHGLEREPVVVYNACSRSRPEPAGRLRALYGIEPEVPIVLCQGGLQPGRGLEGFVRAARGLGDRAVAVLLGEGRPDYVDRLRRLVAPGARVHLGRWVPGGELLEHTCDAALGFIGDRGEGPNNRLGGPNRLFEYIEARVPVLSHDHPGVAEVLAATQTGWVRRWQDPDALADELVQALDRAKSVSSSTLERAASEWCWDAQEPRLAAALWGEGMVAEGHG